LTISSDVGIVAQEIGADFPDTITISSGTGSSYYYNTGAGSVSNNITISGGGSSYTIGAVGSGGTVTINDINATPFNWKMPEEFVDAFPDYDRVEKMCKEYPGLAIAFEKFKTVYKLVKDDYDTPKNKRPKP
jgi:hypothetical protein